MSDAPTAAAEFPLTDEQRRIVEWEDGPLVVIAGAGTGKTRVIIERVRRLLATKGAPADDAALPGTTAVGRDPFALPAEASEASGTGDPFAGPLLPEQILVLTYNVKAAQELTKRFEERIGPAAASRLQVKNFHSFCQQVLIDSAADAGLPELPDVLDGVGQALLLLDIRPSLPLRYYAGSSDLSTSLGAFVGLINRAKDELVTPDDVDAFVAAERAGFEVEFGPYEAAILRLDAMGTFAPIRAVRAEYAKYRKGQLASGPADDGADGASAPDLEAVEKIADREARRTVGGTGAAVSHKQLGPERSEQARALAVTYLADAAALEVLRLSELALVYRAYEEERARRGALDFGDQIAAVIRLFTRRPNVLRRWQRQFRYLLVDEFQDANIAQIELIELLGRTPDRPDNVMVVGDDDQSIYRFRGASYAAFVELDRRFAQPPAHDPTAPAPGEPRRMRIEKNFRSRPPVLTVANRLIARNRLRYVPDKALVPSRTDGPGSPVSLWICDGPDEEAAAIVERIGAIARAGTADGGPLAVPWHAFAVLYRKHRHREAIVARLREAQIPYTVSGGVSLFAAPEVRDLEQALRALGDPFDDVAVARVLSAGPWRLDALELLAISRAAKRAGRHLAEAVREAVASGSIEVDAVVPAGNGPDGIEAGDAAAVAAAAGPATDAAIAAGRAPSERDRAKPPGRLLTLTDDARARLRRFLALLDELSPDSIREGPHTLLERWVERTGVIADLLTAGTLEGKRAVANLGSFLRFAADWQREHPRGTLQTFVAYLDAFQAAGGELPTSVELAEDIEGVRLMSLYQAKGLEYDHVFVPYLLQDEWPVRARDDGLFPRALMREVVPVGDVHTEEERRLLYVAITRAREQLVLTTQAGPAVKKHESSFLTELLEGATGDLVVEDRCSGRGDEAVPAATSAADEGAEDDEAGDALPVAPPDPRERRAELRRQAVELLSMLERVAPDDPEAAGARTGLVARLASLGEAVARSADAARAAGLDPVTLRSVTSETGAGAELLRVAPLPGTFSYTQLDTYERCGAMFAFKYVYKIPTGEVASALGFGVTAHSAFETFTKERRRRAAAGEPPPTREDLQRYFEAAWRPESFPDRTTEETYRRRVGSMLDGFWKDELAGAGSALHEELPFEIRIDPGDGSPEVRIGGMIDRIDRLPSGGIDVIDYKTGRSSSQKEPDKNLQLTLYALAARDALGLGTPERLTLYFTEEGTRKQTTRTDEQLDTARQDLIVRARAIRSGDFHASPGERVCGYCDYRRICPDRVG